MKVIICDDEIKDAESTKNMIDGYRFIKDVKICEPDEMIFDIEEDFFDYDIAILDIEYHKEINGIDIGHLINLKHPYCQIIYLTRITDYASDVYETEHVYFVTKQNQKKTLFRALDKAYELYTSRVRFEYLELYVDRKKNIILQDDIVYLERMDRNVYIHTTGDTYETNHSLTSYTRKLSSDFVRCYGSYIINLNYVISIGRDGVVLKDNVRIPVGRTYRDNVVNAYMKFLSKRM